MRLVGKMDLAQRAQLLDEIHAHQPNLLYSALALRRFGASYDQLEVVLNILLVCFEAMKLAGAERNVIDEALQERCLARITGKMRFLEGLSSGQMDETVTASTSEHPEIWLLAFVIDDLKARGMIGIQTETEKFVMLAALNIVECIAEAALRRRCPRQRRKSPGLEYTHRSRTSSGIGSQKDPAPIQPISRQSENLPHGDNSPLRPPPWRHRTGGADDLSPSG